MLGEGAREWILASADITRALLAALAFHTLCKHRHTNSGQRCRIQIVHILTLVRQIELLHASHMHLEVALVREQVLSVAHGAVRLVSARRGRLGTVVFIRSRRPFLARLEQLDDI